MRCLTCCVCPHLPQGNGLDAAAQARAEARLYQGIPAAETHQLLAMLIPCCPKPQQQEPAAHVDPALVAEAAAACSRPLAQQLQHLSSLAETVCELPVMHISPCIAPVSRLQLVPPSLSSSSSAAAAGADGAAGASVGGGMSSPVGSPVRMPYGTPAAAAATAVVVGSPLLQPKQLIDLHTYIACLVPTVVAAAVGNHHQQQLLLLTRLQPITSSSSSNADTAAAAAAEAVLLQLPQGLSAAAWAFYKDQQLALLLHDPAVCRSPSVVSPNRFGSSTAGSSGSSSLYLVGLSEAPWAAVTASPTSLPQQQQQQQQEESSVVHRCIAAGAVVSLQDLPSRSRVLQHGQAGQLAVSRARGLGSLVTEMQHLLLFDLEEDEGEEEEEEGSEGEHGMEQD